RFAAAASVLVSEGSWTTPLDAAAWPYPNVARGEGFVPVSTVAPAPRTSLGRSSYPSVAFGEVCMVAHFNTTSTRAARRNLSLRIQGSRRRAPKRVVLGVVNRHDTVRTASGPKPRQRLGFDVILRKSCAWIGLGVDLFTAMGAQVVRHGRNGEQREL